MLFGTRKWLFVILLVYAGHGARGQADELAQTVSLNIQGQTLAEALALIGKQTPLSFSYNPDKIPARATVNYTVKNQSLAEVLAHLGKTFRFGYRVIEKQIVLLPAGNQPLTFTLSGYVTDNETSESLIGATISVDSLGLGTVANGYGFFSLHLPYGRHTVQTSYLGYGIATQQVDLTQNQAVDFTLTPNAPQLQEIVVQGYSPLNVNLVQTGRVNIPPRAVAESPAAFGEKDVIKSLERIPGISLQSEGSTFFYVRGGNKDQNLILIDDAPIYNPTHLLGLFSSIVPDVVNSIAIYKSDFPLAKGGRLSSVIDIKTREGNKNRFSAWGNIGLVSTQLGIEGPFKQGASSYIVSGRLSRVKWVFKQEIPDLDQFQFYDLTGKMNFRLNQNNKLYFSVYSGADYFLTTETGLSWSNLNGSVRWNNLINENTFVNTTFYGSNYEYLFHISRPLGRQWRSRIGELGLKTDFSHFINSRQELAFGFSLNGRTINPGNLTGLDSIPAGQLVSVRNNLETVVYLQHEIRGGKWGLKYGLRASLWTSIGEAFEFTFDENGRATDTLAYSQGEAYNNYVQVEPRITGSYFINSNASLKLSYGRSVQNLHLISNTISPFTSFEIWLPSGPNIKPQQADQLTLGYYHFLPSLGVALSAEGYYKYLYNQLDYAAHAATLLNPTVESQLEVGQARAYGIEFLARKDEGRLRGMFSYTYARVVSTFANINQGRAFNAYADRPHNLNINLTYDAGLRVILSSNFNYTSGLPFSSPTAFYRFNGSEVPVYARKNNDRFPAYHRLDIAAEFILNKNPDNNFRHSLTLSIYNLYGRKNPVFINFNKTPAGNGQFEVPVNLLTANRVTTRTYLYRVTPSISYQFRF